MYKSTSRKFSPNYGMIKVTEELYVLTPLSWGIKRGDDPVPVRGPRWLSGSL